MKPTNEYAEALANATAFKMENPDEKQVTGARIYNVNVHTVRSKLRREQQRAGTPLRQRGGHNKVLSEAQVTAIYKYVEESYLQGYGATNLQNGDLMRSAQLLLITHILSKRSNSCGI